MRRTGAIVVVVIALAGCSFVARVSQRSGVFPPPGNGASGHPSISSSGRYVAFESDATDLVPGDTNGVRDVFVHDVVAHVTTRVSVTDAEGQATGPSRKPSISDDGRRVAFETDAPDMVAGDADTVTDIVVRDLDAGTSVLASVTTGGGSIPDPAIDPILAGEASVVTFTERVPVPNIGFCCVPIGPVVRDLDADTTTTVSSGIRSGDAAISDDGTRVAFGTIVPLANNDGTFDARVVEVPSGDLVAAVGSGTLTHQAQGYFAITLSGDGTKVGFFLGNSSAGEVRILDVDDPAAAADFVASLGGVRALRLSDDGATLLAWAGSGGAAAALARQPGGTAFQPVATNGVGVPIDSVAGADLSGDGAWCAFVVTGGVMLADDANGVDDVYIRSVGASIHGPA